jgi:hypothetical protein
MGSTLNPALLSRGRRAAPSWLISGCICAIASLGLLLVVLKPSRGRHALAAQVTCFLSLQSLCSTVSLRHPSSSQGQGWKGHGVHFHLDIGHPLHPVMCLEECSKSTCTNAPSPPVPPCSPLPLPESVEGEREREREREGEKR